MIIVPAFLLWIFLVEYRISDGRHTLAGYFLLYLTAISLMCIGLSKELPFSLPGFFYLGLLGGMFWLGHSAAVLCTAGFSRRASAAFAAPIRVRIEETLRYRPAWVVLNLLLAAGLLAGVAAILALINGAAQAGVKISNPADLLNVPAYYSGLRYTTGVQEVEPLLVRFCIPFIEASASVGGILATMATARKYKVLLYIPLIIALLMTLITGSRSYILMNTTWFMGSLLAIFCIERRPLDQLRSLKFWIIFSVVAAISVVMVTAFQILRFGLGNPSLLTFNQFMQAWIPGLASSIVGPTIATLVFDHVSQSGVALHLATYTFAPVMAWFNLESVRYPQTYYLLNGQTDSNIYSLFGFMLMDFGPTLTAIAFFLSGALGALAVLLARLGQVVALPTVIASACVIIYSPIHNFFFWTTHVLLFLGMSGFWGLIQYLSMTSKPQKL